MFIFFKNYIKRLESGSRFMRPFNFKYPNVTIASEFCYTIFLFLCMLPLTFFLFLSKQFRTFRCQSVISKFQHWNYFASEKVKA